MLALPFGVVVLAFVGLCLIMLAPALSRGLTGWLKATLSVAAFTLGPLAQLSVALARWLTARLSDAVVDASARAVAWLGALYGVLAHIFRSALGWPLELYQLQRWLVVKEVPRLIAALAHGATSIVEAAPKEITKLWRAIVNVERWVTTHATAIAFHAAEVVLGPWVGFLRWLQTHVHAITAVLPKVLPLPHGLTARQIRRLVRKYAREEIVGLSVAAVAFALGRLRLGWLRCKTGNLEKAAKRICSVDIGWLENALAGLLTVFGTLSLVAFAHEIYELTADAAGAIRHFWRADVAASTSDNGLGVAGTSLLGGSGVAARNPGLGDAA